MEDLRENSPTSPYCLTHGSTPVAVAPKRFFLETPVDIFGKQAAKSRKILKCLSF